MSMKSRKKDEMAIQWGYWRLWCKVRGAKLLAYSETSYFFIGEMFVDC